MTFDTVQSAADIHCLTELAPFQRVLLDRPVALRPLYWREHNTAEHFVSRESGALHLPPGATVSFDTYFNAVFERQWRTHTQLRALRLTLTLEGPALLRIWRRTPEAGSVLLHEALADGAVETTLPACAHFRQAGLVWFELTAREHPVILRTATWSAPATTAKPVRLAVVICTFNRELELAEVLTAIAEDPALDRPIARVIVVNQGRPNLREQPGIARAALKLGRRLHIVEQANLGGAGGFGRGLLEALDDTTTTHVCFLDDDVRLEPESLLRMASFFALAEEEFAIGGHMLDAIRPTTLYEAGARVAEDGTLRPLNAGPDLRKPAELERLLDPAAMHYNGWWMFGFPKSLVDRAGMPYPCFIRGDDVEYGLRLHNMAIPTIGLPGIGIWHEPFYLKIGGWQLYYEIRNALMAAALHQDFTPRRVALRAFKRLMIHLLTFRYYDAALIIRALQDATRSPAILDQDPRPIHASLNALRTQYPQQWTPRERVLPPAPVGRSPRHIPGFVLAFAHATARNWLTPSRLAAPQRIEAHNLVWFRVISANHLAVDTHWDRELPTFRRDRTAFCTLLREGLTAIRALHAAAPRLQRAWHAEAPRLTSPTFWRSYLGLSTTPPADKAPRNAA